MTLFCPNKDLLSLTYDVLDNACFTSIGYADPVYGAGDDIVGTGLDPSVLSDGTKFSGFYWEADGSLYAKFGDSANSKVFMTEWIVITSLIDSGVVLHWNDATKRYEGNDQKLTDRLIDQYNTVGMLEDMCFILFPLVEFVIYYTDYEVKK